jgi:NADP-dependent 3-hydroxy acid dehydrogenase YdfG
MMAAWKDRDYQKMARYPLPFGHVDIVFINAGLARRQAANAAAGQMTQISEIKD